MAAGVSAQTRCSGAGQAQPHRKKAATSGPLRTVYVPVYWPAVGHMNLGADPQEEVHRYRDLARRARLMALGLSQNADRVQLNSYADELEKRVAGWRGKHPCRAPRRPAAHQQHQVQQQQATEPASELNKSKR